MSIRRIQNLFVGLAYELLAGDKIKVVFQVELVLALAVILLVVIFTMHLQLWPGTESMPFKPNFIMTKKSEGTEPLWCTLFINWLLYVKSRVFWESVSQLKQWVL